MLGSVASIRDIRDGEFLLGHLGQVCLHCKTLALAAASLRARVRLTQACGACTTGLNIAVSLFPLGLKLRLRDLPPWAGFRAQAVNRGQLSQALRIAAVRWVFFFNCSVDVSYVHTYLACAGSFPIAYVPDSFGTQQEQALPVLSVENSLCCLGAQNESSGSLLSPWTEILWKSPCTWICLNFLVTISRGWERLWELIS